jgi:hypothetical protein
MRRIRVFLLVILVLSAGCFSNGNGTDRIVASGTPATIQDASLAETGYERIEATNRTRNTTVSASISGDVELRATRDVTATTPIRLYKRTTGSGSALVAVVSSPAIQPIENQPIYRNPLPNSPTQLVSYVQSKYHIDSLKQTKNTTITLLGNKTGFRTYAGTTRNGTDVRVHIASVRDGNDFVTVIAIHPASVHDRARLMKLLRAVKH